MRRSQKIRLAMFLLPALVIAGVLAWSSDTITLQDEWTIYMARCREGTWQGQHCSGRLVAAERHHFVADKPKGEVAFDVVGMAGSAGRLSQCTVDDGRNWTCLAGGTSTVPATRQLTQGDPANLADDSGRARRVSKRQWWWLRLGLPAGSDVWR